MNEKKNLDSSYLIIENLHFSENQNNLNEYIKYDALAKISFIDCIFDNIFSIAVIGSCRFQNCTFNNFNARKSLFSNCQFSNCQFKNCGMRRVEFTNSRFTNCEFVQVDLTASDFMRCKFKKTKFIESNLTAIFVFNVEIWKSDSLIKIENDDDFKQLLVDNNSS